MRQINQGLRGQLEQLQQTLKNQVQKANQKEIIQNDKIQSLTISIEKQKQKMKNLKQNWLNLQSETKKLNSQLKDPKIFQGIKSVIYDQASRYDKEIEIFRISLLQKNKEIGDLFMKTKKQEEHFEQKQKELEKRLKAEQEKEIGVIVFKKNQEIANLFTENLEFKQKIENINRELIEQTQILETVQQESAMLKDQIRSFQSEQKILIQQIQNYKKSYIEIQQVNLIQANVEQLQTQISEKDNQLQEYIQMKNDELKQLEDEIDQYQIDIDKKQHIIDQFQNQLKEVNCLNNNYKLQQERIISDHQSKISMLEKQILQKQSYNQVVQIESPIIKNVPKLNLQKINKPGNDVLFEIKQNEQQQNIEDIFPSLICQNYNENDIKIEENIELNNDIINEWGASMSSELDMQQSINIQLNDNYLNQNIINDASEDEFIRMKTYLDSNKLDIIISQIDKPNHETQKLDDFFSQLKKQELIQKIEINEELDREIFNNNHQENGQSEKDQFQKNTDNNQQQNILKKEIQEQQWGELDIQLESDINNEQTLKEPVISQQPKKKKQKHKKQKSVHLQKSNQFSNYQNQQFQDNQNDQENKSVKKQDQMQFFQEMNEQDQNIIIIDQNNLNAINEVDSNVQGESSAKKENSKEFKNNLSNNQKPQIYIETAESIEDKILQKNQINQKEKDNDFNSSVFPDSIHNEDGKEEEQDMMIMTINSGDVNLQLLDSVQSGKYSFIHDGYQNNNISTNSPQKNIQEFIVEYQELNQLTKVDKDILDLKDVEIEDISQKKYHQKSSQSFHQRNAEMIDQVIMGTQVSDNQEDQEYLQKRLKEQLEEYNQQNNSTQLNQIQDLIIDNIKPPAQPDEYIQNGELPEQILSDLEEELDIQQNENPLLNNIDKDHITTIFEEQNKNQIIEIIPEMEIEEEDENIQQDLIQKNQSEEKKIDHSKVEKNIEIELEDDLWGDDLKKDQILNLQNKVLPLDFIINENNDEKQSFLEVNHQQKSKQYQNIRKSNKQKQKDKLNLKKKFLLLNQTMEMNQNEQAQLQRIKEIDNQINTQNSEIQDINRMIAEDINQQEKEDLGNIYNQISITQQNRALESARVHTSNPLQHFQQVKTELEDEQILQSSSQKQPHGHSNSQQFIQQNQNKPLNTIRQNKKQIPNSVLKNMMENVPKSSLPSESLEEVEDSYKESEFYSPIKKKLEDQISYITSSEYNGLSSQKKMRRIHMMNQTEEESLQEIDNIECEEKEDIEKVIEDVKGEEIDEDDKIKIIEAQQNDVDIVFSELDAENEFSLGISENQNSQNKAEVFDQILKGQQEALNLDYIDLNNFQLNDFENEIQSIQSIVSGSMLNSVQESKKEENIDQLFDSVNQEKEKIKQVQI